jgi:hypothetical protein
MSTSKWVAISCLVAMIGTLSCSSGGSSGRVDYAEIEAQVERALQIMAFILEELNPFQQPPAPTPGPSLFQPPDPDCTDISDDYCESAGHIWECPTQTTDVQVVFDTCTDSQLVPGSGIFNYMIDGDLIYRDEGWPEGWADALVDSQSAGPWQYEMAFDFTENVQMIVTTPSGIQADCVGSLVTYEATCGPVSADPI